jgi:hypothetical protein
VYQTENRAQGRGPSPSLIDRVKSFFMPRSTAGPAASR